MEATANLSYISEGNGFPVVFLHGFCESKEIWRDYIKPLTATYRIILPDLPGFGESSGNSHHHSIEDMAEEVYKLLLNIGVDQCILIAHSMGGYVTLALAEKDPKVLKGIGLFHSSAYADTEEKKHTRNKTAEFIDKKGVEAFIENFVPSLFYKGRRQELSERIEWMKKLAAKTPKETAIATTKAMRDRPDRTHVLKQQEVPVLFIAGREDEAVPFAASQEQFALAQKSVNHVLEDTAHMGMFERPQESLQMIADFIQLCVAEQDKNAKH